MPFIHLLFFKCVLYYKMKKWVSLPFCLRGNVVKKVLFVATVVRLHINMFHKPFIKWFHDQGWQVDVAANNDYEDKSECVIPYCDNFHCMPFERSPLKKGNLDAYKQLKKLLDSEHYDIIHCHTPMGSVITRLAAGSARNKGTKVIYTAHGFHFYKGSPKFNWLVYYPIEKILSRRTDLLLTMNQEDYSVAMKFHAKNVMNVNGVGMDMSKFTEATAADKKAVRAELGLKDDDVFAISVAQLIPRKNHTVLIQAISKLKDPHFHLYILGDGVQEQELKEQTKELGVENQIHFLGFRRDVYRLCKAADIFLFASLQEGLPVAIMEAMACGLPIIASEIRGNIDLIELEKGGWLVPPTDVDGFMSAIHDAMAHRDKWHQMKEFNLAKVRNYSIDAVMDQMAKIYKSVM